MSSRLKGLRESKHMTQSDLANILGKSQVAISKYESGDRQPDYESLEKYAEYFHVSSDYLLGLDKKKNEYYTSVPPLPDDIRPFIKHNSSTIMAVDDPTVNTTLKDKKWLLESNQNTELGGNTMESEAVKEIKRKAALDTFPYRVHWSDGTSTLVWSDGTIRDLLAPRWKACEHIPACGFSPIDKLELKEKRVYVDGDLVGNPVVISLLKEAIFKEQPHCTNDVNGMLYIYSVIDIRHMYHEYHLRFMGYYDYCILFDTIEPENNMQPDSTAEFSTATHEVLL